MKTKNQPCTATMITNACTLVRLYVSEGNREQTEIAVVRAREKLEDYCTFMLSQLSEVQS